MEIDLHSKAVHLLETIANSVHERYPTNPNFLCFSQSDVVIVEEWLKNFIDEQKSPHDG